MDSLTQIALGAAVGTAVMGRRAGYRAPLWGAVLGTLPDLDALIPMGGPVADFTYHRSFSHSLLVLAAMAPLWAWLIRQIHPAYGAHRRGWLWLALLALLTHPLLDAFTIYGTQLLWPLDHTPIGLGSIFIIDPLYTLPLLAGAGAFLALRDRSRGLRLNAIGLLLSCSYLGWSAWVQEQVEATAQRHLAASAIAHHQVLVQPAPFTTLLWRVLVMSDDAYYEGFHSLWDQRPLQLRRYPSTPAHLDGLDSHWPVERLRWFTKGFYKVASHQGELIISDLRMGLEPDYVFQFKVAQQRGETLMATPDERRVAPRSLARLPAMWRRIWQQPAAADAPGF